MDSLKELRKLDYQRKLEKYRDVPRLAIPYGNFNDRTSNGLTQSILRWLELKGHYATRINTTGRKLKDAVIVDVIGRSRVTPGKWIQGTTKKGTADIHAVVNGKHISVEVKVGKDRLSIHQHKTKQAIEQCGGTYLIIKTFAEFHRWYSDFIKP